MPNSTLSLLANPFLFDSSEVRTATDNNQEVWFCAKDVCDVLDITWNGSTLENMPENWKLMLKLRTSFGEKDTNFLNEAGLYRLVFRSNKPKAEQFANWVCEEVLPAIRKHGFYFAPNSAFAKLQALLTPKAEPLSLSELEEFKFSLKEAVDNVVMQSLEFIPVLMTAQDLINPKNSHHLLTKEEKPQSRKRWTPEEDAKLVALRSQGFSAAQIAKKIGRTFMSVQTRVMVLRAQEEV